MRAFDAIDVYCERTGPQFWAEPVNALTNLAFLFAACLLLREMGRRAPGDLRALAWLVGLVGAGSLVFHTVGQVWATVLDIGFIAVFVVVYLQRALVRLHGWRNLTASAAVVGVLVVTAGIAVAARTPVLNGSELYLGPWLALLALALGSRRPGPRRWLRLATGLFAFSIVLRSVDMAVCTAFPLGTHFGWHLGNALVLWCVVHALLSEERR